MTAPAWQDMFSPDQHLAALADAIADLADAAGDEIAQAAAAALKREIETAGTQEDLRQIAGRILRGLPAVLAPPPARAG